MTAESLSGQLERDFREEKEAIIRSFGGEKYLPLCNGRLIATCCCARQSQGISKLLDHRTHAELEVLQGAAAR